MKKAKKRTNKKKNNLPKILLGLTVLGGAVYAGYQFWYKPMIEKKAVEDAAKQGAAAAQAAAAAAQSGNLPAAASPVIATIVEAAQAQPVNAIPKSNLSPIGTDPKKINWGAKVKYGDKGGEVEVIQFLFNAIAKLAGSNTIDEDGIFGSDTLAKKRLNFGSVYTITPKQVYDKLQERKKIAANTAANKAILASLPSWAK